MKNRKLLSILMALCVSGVVLTAVSAEPPKGESGDEGKMAAPEMMMEHSKMGKHHGMMGKGPKMCPMMKGMMEKKLVATSDGGVVVLLGNKLVKYDKDLNVVKEVEVKIDMAAMKQAMMEQMKDCPMMKDGMGKMMADDDDDNEGPGEDMPGMEESGEKPAGK